jgi:ribosomal-protein-alanine N-acetyltransferase
MTDRVVIAPMRRRHLRGVVAIEERTNPRPWSYGLFAGELRLPHSRVYAVALDRHVVVGFGGVMLEGEEAHVTNIAVAPERHRQGIGARLMLVLMRECLRRDVRDVTLEVRASNRAAQELYRRFGFAPGGVRPNYYAEVNEDALIMWATDIGSEVGLARLEDIERGFDGPLRIEGFDG